MTGPATIYWRDALKSGERITDNGGLIFCGTGDAKRVCIWHPYEIQRAVEALTARAREQARQEAGKEPKA